MKDPFARAGYRLKPLQVTGHPQPVDLIDLRLTIGRAEDNDVSLPGEEFPSVSTHHVRLEEREGELWVEDMESTNGTLVNGKRVDRQRLSVGDVVQLGSIGPRFVVISAAPLSQTMFVDPKSVGMSAPRDELSETRVHQLMHTRARKSRLQLVVAAAAVVVALVLWGLNLSREGLDKLEEAETAHRSELEDARRVIEELRERDRQREAQIVRVEVDRAAHVKLLEATIVEHEDEARSLRAGLATLREEGAAASEIERLEAAIADTQKDISNARTEFEMFDPVNLEQLRLSGVRAVRESVVLLEVEVKLQNEETNTTLHVGFDGAPNFDDIGFPWALESTGSGFCVSPEGWILTNAHVVRAPRDHALLAATAGLPVTTQVTVNAVFSGESRRYPVEIVKIADGDVDLALVKIRPFDTMPHVVGFDPDVAPPEPGSDLFLVGFPLGNFALQEGRTVIASTFRGILSRMVGGHMQVDAGVHPGNSGGPITDVQGRVIGVVFSVQALPDQTAVYTIGYGIPIAQANEVWPPPEGWE